MELHLESWVALTAAVGPLFVGFLTAVDAPSKVKGWISLVLLAGMIGVEIYLTGGWTTDVAANALLAITVWETAYARYKAIGLTKWLQSIGFQFGA